jgi:hypothetical protein
MPSPASAIVDPFSEAGHWSLIDLNAIGRRATVFDGGNGTDLPACSKDVHFTRLSLPDPLPIS